MPMYPQASAIIGGVVENPHTDLKAGDAGPHYRAADEAPRQPSGLVGMLASSDQVLTATARGKSKSRAQAVAAAI